MSGDFGSLVLVLGDFHVPDRKCDVPACFRDLLNTDKINAVLCTGNIGCKTQVEKLEDLAGSDCRIVCGDRDSCGELPEMSVTQIGDFKIGLIHGHQILPWGDQSALRKCASRLGVDVLVSGHTHRHSVIELNNKYLVNPGSVTGAANTLGEYDIAPSFMLMDVQGPTMTLYTYEEDLGGEAKVTMNELKKKA